jgi:outer membrane lipoprotein-sorting protein
MLYDGGHQPVARPIVLGQASSLFDEDLRMHFLLAAVLLMQDKSAEQLVDQLRSDKVEERNKAARELKKLEEAALPALEKAARDPDTDVSRSAKEILTELRSTLDARLAEKAFRKIEETIDKAKTMKVKFTLSLDEPRSDREEKPSASGEYCVKEGNRVFILLLDRGRESRIIADGTRMLMPGGRNGEVPEAAWPRLGELMTTGFVRAGIVSLDFYCHRRPAAPGEEIEIKKVLQVSDFKCGPDEREAKTITFNCSMAREFQSQAVSLTYDPKTYRLLKRTTAVAGGAKVVSVVERYEEFILNADIPDDQFKLPETKK